MRAKHYAVRPVLLFMLAVLFPLLCSGQKERYTSLEDALTTGRRMTVNDVPSGLNWIGEGMKYSYTKQEPGVQQIWTGDPASGREELVFNSRDMFTPGTGSPFHYGNFRWTKDGRHLFFQTNFIPVWRYSGNADYYYYSIEKKTLVPVIDSAFTAEVSPDGSMVGYEKGGNLHVYGFSSGIHTQLTDDAGEHFYNGRFGWAYEEEFGLVQAWEWSPDSRYIAFWQSDERAVPVYQLTDFSGKHPEYMKVPYPKAGDPIPLVKIGVIDIRGGGETRWLDIDLDGGYIPRIYWTSDPGVLAVVHMNRNQNSLRLYFFDVNTGGKKLVMEEYSDTWIDIFDFFAGSLHFFVFPAGIREFFWISDRDGWSHIYRYSYDGKLLSKITTGQWEVTRIEAVDVKNRKVFFVSTEASPLERHLYSVSFDGKKKTRLTTVPGTHSLNVSSDARYYFDKYSGIDTPQHVELWSTKGKMLKRFTRHDDMNAFRETHHFAPRELFSFTTTDGQTLDGYLIRPPDFDPAGSYPLLLDVYGAPGAQSVYNSFIHNSWHQYLAQQGYVIAGVNNRGGGNYGRAFEKMVYKKLGAWESHDFVETANYLASMPWVDGERMAIRGHSYGGYAACYTMLTNPGVFRVSIAAAPTTSDELYDAIYSERYMGMPEENQEGYDKSSCMGYADNLQGKMLLVHSLMDENVHPQNTFQLITALIGAGKDVDLKIFPAGAHGVAYDFNSYLLLMKIYTNYLEKYLKNREE